MRYGLLWINLGAFLGSIDSTASGLAPTDSHLGIGRADLPALPAYMLAPGIPTPGPPILLRPSITRTHKYANINAFPISYAFPPRLRGRLTLGRLPLPRKPRVFGEYVFHIFYRYSCQHNHFTAVQHAFRHTFSPQRTLPYPIPKGDCQSFGTMLSPVTFSAQSH